MNDKNNAGVAAPARPNEGNPNGFTQEDFLTVRDACLISGAALQRFKPGGLDAMAEMIERDLANAKSLMLSAINRRRGEKVAKVFRAAEKFREACADLHLSLNMIDPSEKK